MCIHIYIHHIYVYIYIQFIHWHVSGLILFILYVVKLFAILNWNIWRNKNDYRQLKNKINVDKVSAVRSRAGKALLYSQAWRKTCIHTHTHARDRAQEYSKVQSETTPEQLPVLCQLLHSHRWGFTSSSTLGSAGKCPHTQEESRASRPWVHMMHVWPAVTHSFPHRITFLIRAW